MPYASYVWDIITEVSAHLPKGIFASRGIGLPSVLSKGVLQADLFIHHPMVEYYEPVLHCCLLECRDFKVGFGHADNKRPNGFVSDWRMVPVWSLCSTAGDEAKKELWYSLTGRGLFSELSNLVITLVLDHNQEELTVNTRNRRQVGGKAGGLLSRSCQTVTEWSARNILFIRRGSLVGKYLL